ncbi:triglyceride lipase ATG15 [Pneumocystis jirovecii RU7]|uniref:triacylglycerol lipase n=1 Tax=Pneumocystis jirovecii (strain RU7) TaxID=1408657 RepID=A0A0W4ZIW8_PNEJ7|nr:triglyceride lipase ATG15 [Pneumocystis jirovecii RU7]KTW28307.1 hypothetical protein T551_02726 [Pneumocystis jirovecii RU7]
MIFVDSWNSLYSLNLHNKPELFTLKHILSFGINGEIHKYRFLNVKKLSTLDLFSYKHSLRIMKKSMKIRRLTRQSRNSYHKYLLFYQNKELSFLGFKWILEDVDIPDIEDKQTVISMAEIANNAYIDIPKTGDWIEVGKGIDVLNDDVWDKNVLHGHVFADNQNKTVIIALKGTSPELFGLHDISTGTKDKINDNLLFSCCCGRVSWTWTPVCDCFNGAYSCDQQCLEKELLDESHYYNIALNIYYNVSNVYPDSNIWMVGHSLGGALSSLVGLTFGLPTVTFEAPGEKLAAKRLHLPLPPGLPDNESHVWHFGHTADPIFMGTCNGPTSTCWYGGYAMETRCRSGLSCIYDVVNDKGWRVAIGTHRIRQVIDIIKDYKDVAKCFSQKDCMDCLEWNFYDNITDNKSIKYLK